MSFGLHGGPVVFTIPFEETYAVPIEGRHFQLASECVYPRVSSRLWERLEAVSNCSIRVDQINMIFLILSAVAPTTILVWAFVWISLPSDIVVGVQLPHIPCLWSSPSNLHFG